MTARTTTALLGLPTRLARAVQCLSRLPGVGERTALRHVLFLATADEHVARELGAELSALRDYLRPCLVCGHLAESTMPGAETLCSICADHKRDPALLCVVARPQDVLAIERSVSMRGRYFVLGKLLSPLDGVSIEDLPVDALRTRVRGGDGAQTITEVLVATPPSVDGEATALLLARALAGMGVRISRIASGIPHGGDLEYADQVTLGRAIEGRKVVTT